MPISSYYQGFLGILRPVFFARLAFKRFNQLSKYYVIPTKLIVIFMLRYSDNKIIF